MHGGTTKKKRTLGFEKLITVRLRVEKCELANKVSQFGLRVAAVSSQRLFRLVNN